MTKSIMTSLTFDAPPDVTSLGSGYFKIKAGGPLIPPVAGMTVSSLDSSGVQWEVRDSSGQKAKGDATFGPGLTWSVDTTGTDVQLSNGMYYLKVTCRWVLKINNESRHYFEAITSGPGPTTGP